MIEWLTAIQTVAFKDDVSKITSIEEDNDLYCSTGEGIFQVTLWPSDASKRCGLDPSVTYTLLLTSTAVQLRNKDNKLLYTWPYCYIRRYGYRNGKFTFEAGRKCDSGEGVFHLQHSNQQEIFRCLSSKMKSMKKLLSGESTTSLLDCGDNQFQAALSMEARSRSPLPPSPTSSTRVHDIDLNNSIQNSVHSLISFTSSLKDFDKSQSQRVPLPKPRPAKPPRKNLPVKMKSIDDTSDDTDISDLNKYDEVEFQQDAWKTRGILQISHTESIDNDSDHYSNDEIQDNLTKNTIKPPTILLNEKYDKLQFFGSTSKLNIPGYKQVAPLSIHQPVPSTPSWNDYDEVEVNMQAARLADDSHLGYGMIRKTTQPKVTENIHVNHEIINDNIYAVVSKPKQV